MATRRQPQHLPRPSWGWQENALCRGESLTLFFGPEGERAPDREVRERKAKDICMGCPVRTECGDYAVSRPEKYGTWGGLNDDERTSLRRSRMRQTAMAATGEANKGRCPECGWLRTLTQKGLVSSHQKRATGEHCPGRGRLPLPADLDIEQAKAS